MHDDFTSTGMVPVLPQVDALPCAQQQFTCLKWHAELGRGQGALDVSGHVIWPLQGVRVQRVVLGHQSIQPLFQVHPRAVVVVFLNQEARGGVADKQCA